MRRDGERSSMVRALDCDSSGWGFESPRPPQFLKGVWLHLDSVIGDIESIESRDTSLAPVAQLDRASASEAEGQRFESSQARQLHKTITAFGLRREVRPGLGGGAPAEPKVRRAI